MKKFLIIAVLTSPLLLGAIGHAADAPPTGPSAEQLQQAIAIKNLMIDELKRERDDANDQVSSLRVQLAIMQQQIAAAPKEAPPKK